MKEGRRRRQSSNSSHILRPHPRHLQAEVGEEPSWASPLRGGYLNNNNHRHQPLLERTSWPLWPISLSNLRPRTLECLLQMGDGFLHLKKRKN